MDQLWTTLLALAKKVSDFSGVLHQCYFKPGEQESVFINSLPHDLDTSEIIAICLDEQSDTASVGVHFSLSGFCNLRLDHNHFLSESQIDFLKTYLPYCFLPLEADRRKRAISIAHFAQTLDGRIATGEGDSHWIGNEENLDHAHRMRALCDAILIGKYTLLHDAPKLTVRRVEGEHPRRVVIGSPQNDYTSLFESSSEPVIVIGKEASKQNGRILYHHLNAENGCIRCEDILDCLYQQGIKTVYVEGGAITTSNFIKDRSLDILQLHLSPYLFGSGKPAIVLPGISQVDEGIQFRHFSFHKIGDTMMFVGEPA